MKLSLKFKLIFGSVIVITITAISLGYVSYSNMKKEAWRAIESESNHTAQASAKGIGYWMLEKRHTLEALTEAIENNQSINIVSRLKQTYTSGGFVSSFYSNANGEIFWHDPSLNKSGDEPRTKSWYKKTVAENSYIITKPYVSHSLNSLVVTIANPVKKNDNVIGVVASELSLEMLKKDINNIPVPGNGYAILLDKTGFIVTHPNPDLQLKNNSKIGPDFSLENLRRELKQDAFFKTKIDGQEKAVKLERMPGTTWAIALVMDVDVLEAPLRKMLWEQFFFSIVILFVMGVSIACFVNRQLTELGKVSDALSEIANGDGDLTVSINTRSNDEVGKLAQNFNVFVARLHQMVTRLSEITTQLSAQSNETLKAATERHQQIRYQQDEITMVATAVTEMATSTHEIAGNAENTAKITSRAVVLSRKGREQADKSQNSIGDLATEVTSAVNIIEDLNGHAQQITTILETIRAIAEQTNLLALNAAIEAARAGEHGRGFAVVADEVRVLSQRTHSSIEEIQQMIETLQLATRSAVTVMSNSQKFAETSVIDVGEAGSSLEQISHAISDISDMATQIASAVEEQSSVTSEISRNSEGVKNVADNLAKESQETARNAEELNLVSSELEEEVRRFKL